MNAKEKARSVINSYISQLPDTQSKKGKWVFARDPAKFAEFKKEIYTLCDVVICDKDIIEMVRTGDEFIHFYLRMYKGAVQDCAVPFIEKLIANTDTVINIILKSSFDMFEKHRTGYRLKKDDIPEFIEKVLDAIFDSGLALLPITFTDDIFAVFQKAFRNRQNTEDRISYIRHGVQCIFI